MKSYSEIKEMLKYFENNDVLKHNRDAMDDDLKFLHESDGQWDERIIQEWENETIPLMQFDKLNTIVSRIKNRIKALELNCRIEPFGTDGKESAKVFNQLIRTITGRSDFKNAVDIANQLQIDSGLGALELSVDKINDNDFNDDIAVTPIMHPSDLILPPNSLEPLKWDGCGVKHSLTKEQLIRIFGKSKYAEIRSYGGSDYGEYGDAEKLSQKTIVKFFYKTFVKSKLLLFSNNLSLDIADSKYLFESQAYVSGQLRVIADKVYEKPIIYCAWLDSNGKLSDDDMFPCAYIPIIPFFGNVALTKDKIIFKSAIRHLKGMQQYHNYNRMQQMISVDDAIKMPWIGPQNSFDPDKDKWGSRFFNRHSYVQYKGVTPPVKPPLSIPIQELSALSADNRADLLESAGMNESAMGNETNIIAAKALFRQAAIAEQASFEFIDNHKKALDNLCTLLIDMIPRVYSDNYIMRYVSDEASGKNAVAIIGSSIQPQDVQSEDPVVVFSSLRMGVANIDVNVGQSQDTIRNDLLDQQMRLIELAPEARAELLPEFIRTLAWNNSEKVASRIEQQAQQQSIPPEAAQQLQQQLAEISEKLRQEMVKNEELRLQMLNKERDHVADMEKIKYKYKELDNEVFEAKTERAKIELEARLNQNIG